MQPLADYVIKHTRDLGQLPNTPPPPGDNKYNLVFFWVEVLPQANAETFRELWVAHQPSYGDQLPLSSNAEYGYIQLGGFVGDQGIALRMMALMQHLGSAKLLTPFNMLPDFMNEELAQKMAGAGYVTIQAL